MPIIVRRCFVIVTPESAEQGDIAECGDDGTREMSVKELARELRGMEASRMPLRAADVDARTWATEIDGSTNYRTGEHRRESLHFDRSNPPSRLKGWRAAFKAAGLAR